MPELGIDLGSRFVKICKKINAELLFEKYDTVDFYKQFIMKGDNGELKIDYGISDYNSYKITATGYGRNLMAFRNAEIISEIKAHFKGAKSQTGLDNFILVDIGGQDSKVIKVKDGFIDDFVMNDKCAASTGRFLENSGRVLQMNVDELSECVLEPVELSSTCAIFSESEIIGKIAEGVSVSKIAAGVNLSVAKRMMPLLKRFSSDKIFISGGVADNYGVTFFIQDLLGKEIELLENYQYNAAIGCTV